MFSAASVAVPTLAVGLGLLLQRFIPGCAGNEGFGFHGCQILSLDLSEMVGLFLIGGFPVAIFCFAAVLPGSIVLGLIASFFERRKEQKRTEA